MKNTKIIVKTKSNSYPIYFGNENLSKAKFLIKKNLPGVKKICIISDKNLPSQTLKKLTDNLKNYKPKIYKISSSEKNKSFKVANKIIEELLKENFNKSDCIIAFGGGIIGDLSAFIANLLKRGLKFINIPTSLLAQADSAIGGKTGVNSKNGKNLIGTIYQPNFVLIDISVLKSLPHKEFVCGYGEILKHSLILNKKFFLWLYKNANQIINYKNKKFLQAAVIKSCKIKSEIVGKDEKETSLRMILNFGHTFAHGFEAAKKFTKKVSHGEAVLLGMMMASQLSCQKKLLPIKDLILIKKHYSNLNLPMKIKRFFKKDEISKIVHFMKKDKKNINNKISLILLKKIGKVTKPNSIYVNDKYLKKFLNSQYI